MHRYIPILAKVPVLPRSGKTGTASTTKIRQKQVRGQSFFNGYLDLMTLWFLNRFGKNPCIFGVLGTLMFFIGFVAVIVVGATKLYDMHHGNPYRLVTESPYFYISLSMMILGTMLFLGGFLGELISRNSPERNHYRIEKEF